MGFWSSLFGFDDRQAPPQVVNQATKFPEELAPYIKELLGEAQTLYGAQKEEGYQPYTGETIAPLTPEELQAQEGLKGLIGTAQPYLKEALETYRTGAEKFTPEAAQEYMSPYQRAVTDIEKREAQKVFERDIMPRFEKQAVQAGGMSGLGSRAAIQAGQLGQAQMQQMGDIEAKGLQKSYMDAQKLFADQKARERLTAGDIGRTGVGMYQAGLADQGLLQDIGQQKRELGQAALDEAYYKFLKEQSYPQDIISQYSGTVYGTPKIGPSRTTTTTGNLAPYQPGVGQQLMGLGLAGLNIYGMGGGFGNSSIVGKAFQAPGGGTRSLLKEGGQIESGLSNLPVVRRQTGGPNKPSLEWLARHGRTLEIRQDAAKKLGLGESIADPRYIKRIQQAPATPLSTTKKALAALSQSTLPPGTLNVGTGGPGEFEGSAGELSARREEGQREKPSGQGRSSSPTDIKRFIQGLYQGDRGDLENIGVVGIDEISGGTIGGMNVKPDIKKTIAAREATLAQDPRFNKAIQRKRKEDAIKKEMEIRTGGQTEIEKLQQEGYTAEEEANTAFLKEQEELVEKLGGYPGDIIGDAIDKGMEERGIVGMLTKTLNVTAKGLGKRSEKINSELRKLNKNEFEIKKELRKDKRTDKLANLEKKQDISLKEIAAKVGLEKELEKLPFDLRKQVLSELVSESALEDSAINKTAKAHKIITDYINAYTAYIKAKKEGTTSQIKGSDYNALIKSIDSKLNSIIDEKTQTIGGKAITAESRKEIANIRTTAERILGGEISYKGRTGPIAARAYANDKINSLGADPRPQGVPSDAKKGTYEGKTIWIIDKNTAYDATGKRIKIKQEN